MTPRPVGLAAARRHSLLVTDDGHVLAAGPAGASECAVADWTDVVAVAAGNVHTAKNTSRFHSVGLCSDGTVLATGWNAHGQCDVGAWTDIVTVAAGWRRTPACAPRAPWWPPAAGPRVRAMWRTGLRSWRSPLGTGTPRECGQTAPSWRPG